ncbi:MAG: aminotransferase class IV [bacterium]|nr:aminotransferase class IV [bacterium]
MNERTAFFNGHFIPEPELRLAPSDVGVRIGEFVFETIRTYDFRPHRLHDHLDRLYASMKALDIDCGMSIEEMEEITYEFIERNTATLEPYDDLMWHVDCSRGIARPYDLGPYDSYERTLFMVVIPLGPSLVGSLDGLENGVPVVIPPTKNIPARYLDPKMKTRNRIHHGQGMREARKVHPRAEALFVDDDGFIAEGGGANFLIVKDGALISPEGRNILRGVTREDVRDLAPQLGMEFVESNIEPYDVMTADEAFFASTPFFVMPVTSIDGREIGTGTPGPVVDRLIDAFAQQVGVHPIEQARKITQPYLADRPKGSRPY